MQRNPLRDKRRRQLLPSPSTHLAIATATNANTTMTQTNTAAVASTATTHPATKTTTAAHTTHDPRHATCDFNPHDMLQTMWYDDLRQHAHRIRPTTCNRHPRVPASVIGHLPRTAHSVTAARSRTHTALLPNCVTTAFLHHLVFVQVCDAAGLVRRSAITVLRDWCTVALRNVPTRRRCYYVDRQRLYDATTTLRPWSPHVQRYVTANLRLHGGTRLPIHNVALWHRQPDTHEMRRAARLAHRRVHPAAHDLRLTTHKKTTTRLYSASTIRPYNGTTVRTYSLTAPPLCDITTLQPACRTTLLSHRPVDATHHYDAALRIFCHAVAQLHCLTIWMPRSLNNLPLHSVAALLYGVTASVPLGHRAVLRPGRYNNNFGARPTAFNLRLTSHKPQSVTTDH